MRSNAQSRQDFEQVLTNAIMRRVWQFSKRVRKEIMFTRVVDSEVQRKKNSFDWMIVDNTFYSVEGGRFT